MLASTLIDWVNNWTGFSDNVGWFLAGLAAVVAYVWRQHRKQIKNVVKEELQFELRSDFDSDLIKKLAEAVEDIHHETQHNDGSSMKDALKRVEDAQSKGFENMENRMNRTDEQIERMDTFIQKLDKAMEYHLGLHDGLGL